MNFHHDLAMITKEELNRAGVVVQRTWDDYHIYMNYLQISHRLFNSSIPYITVYSKEFINQWNDLTCEEREVFHDIEERMRTCRPITQYMGRNIRATGKKKSDFLLKNWNIYHLHLEKREDGQPFTNKRLLFFQPYGRIVHIIAVKNHPKAENWFDRELLEIIFDNWPWLLNYREGIRPTENAPDSEVHELLKSMVTLVPFRNGSLFPTSYGVASSGDSSAAVQTADRVFNSLTIWQNDLIKGEREIKKKIQKKKLLVPEHLDYFLKIENNYFIAYEKATHAKIRMFPIP